MALKNVGALNINWGTEFDDGLRVGPSFPNSAKFKNFGEGMLSGAMSTYSISFPNSSVSAAVDGTVANDNLPNILWCLNGKGAAQGAYIALTPRASATTPAPNTAAEPNFTATPVPSPLGSGQKSVGYNFGGTGRVVVCQVPAALNLAIDFYVVGYDMYMQPMMEKISVAAAAALVTTAGKKAFAIVSGIYATCATAAIPNNGALGATVTNSVGVPYWLNLKADSLLTSATYSTTGLAVIDPPTLVTIDVRGIIGYTPAPANLAGSSTNAMLLMYVPGFNNQINQLAAMKAFGGYQTLGGVNKPIPYQPILQYIPAALYTIPNYPYFGATFNADGTINMPIINTNSKVSPYPVFNNVITQYGAEQFFDLNQAKILALVN